MVLCIRLIDSAVVGSYSYRRDLPKIKEMMYVLILISSVMCIMYKFSHKATLYLNRSK